MGFLGGEGECGGFGGADLGIRGGLGCIWGGRPFRRWVLVVEEFGNWVCWVDLSTGRQVFEEIGVANTGLRREREREGERCRERYSYINRE